jgi:chromosome partitioning protein
MKIIAVISQKGGAGKTTLAVNLAVAAELQDVPTVLVDLDPQSSAKTWHDIRES